jgi:hypothetical protein
MPIHGMIIATAEPAELMVPRSSNLLRLPRFIDS